MPAKLNFRRAFTASGSGPSPDAPAAVNSDLEKHLSGSSDVTTSSGSEIIIDNQPDFRYALIAFIFSIQRIFGSSDFRSSPYASPASLLAYCLALDYALCFYNDAYLRPVASPAAAAILDDTRFSIFLDMFADLYVPDFMVNHLLARRAYLDEIATNVAIIPSLAGSLLATDFGRIFPIGSFLTAHNLIATTPGNTQFSNVLALFYGTNAIELTYAGNAARMFTNGNLFGTQRSGTVAYSNWISTRLETLLNTANIRNLSGRPTLGEFTFTTIASMDATSYNPYLLALTLNHGNVHSLTQLMRQLSSFVNSEFKATKTLGSLISTGSPVNIHPMLCRFALPTWHTFAAHNVTGTTTAIATRTHADAFATAISYLIARPNPVAQTTGIIARLGVQILSSAEVTANAVLSTFGPTQSETTTRSNPDPVTYVTFDLATHVLPPLLIFDPTGNATTLVPSVLTAGYLIESGSHAMTSVRIPDSYDNLQIINSELVANAIPSALFQDATASDTTRFHAQQIAPLLSRANIPARVTINTNTRSDFPIYRQENVLAASANTNTRISLFPGRTLAAYARTAIDHLNDLAFTQSTSPPNVGTQFLLGWSSYRVIDPNAPAGSNVRILMSLRDIYGLRSRVIRSEHPALRLP